MNIKVLIAIIVTVVMNLVVAVAAGYGGATTDVIGDETPVMLVAVVIAFGVNWLAYIPASLLKTEKFFDLTGAITYILTILICCTLVETIDMRAMIAATLVIIWSLRLGSFLFMRMRVNGDDVRFDQIKINPLRFLMVWTLQGSWVFLTSVSALAIITTTVKSPLDIYAYIGIALWVFGFVIEVVSDQQKFAFRKVAANKGRFIHSGLWAWSRHPNYFGEITLWVGITIMALPLLSGWQWIALISPIFVTLLLTKISGIPGLEKTAQKRWGDEKEFQDYVKHTPVLLPRPPAK